MTKLKWPELCSHPGAYGWWHMAPAVLLHYCKDPHLPNTLNPWEQSARWMGVRNPAGLS